MPLNPRAEMVGTAEMNGLLPFISFRRLLDVGL